MKKLITATLLVCLTFMSPTIKSIGDNFNLSFVYPTPYGISDGWYTAKVEYYNSATFKRATYTLNVKVEFNTITAIDFGNGGSVHSGINNSGYMWSGGYLSFQKDYSTGNIISATAYVSVSDSNGMRTFDITI